ncbi:hypothetical protein LCGC14_1394360, partial [marine sediment metagenome]
LWDAGTYFRIQSFEGLPLVINSLGNNVFIGTTTDAGFKLDVNGTARTGALTAIGVNRLSRADSTPAGTASNIFDDAVFGSTDTVNTGITIFGTGQVGIAFGDVASNLVGQIRYQHGTNRMEFFTAGAQVMDLTSGGNFLIGTTTAATGSPRLDVVGDDIVMASNVTDASTKAARFAGRHYTNAEQPMALISGLSTVSANTVHIGGNETIHNTATAIEFYTAANTITIAGTLAADITGVGASSLFHARGSMKIVTGLQVGSPTSGDKGAGTINVATDIYKNDSAYTNPDFVFEYAFANKLANAPQGWKLRSLRETKVYAERWHHLPGVHRDKAMGMFERSDWVAEKMEEVHLHLFTHEDRIGNLEGDNQRLKDECTTLRAQVTELQLAA